MDWGKAKHWYVTHPGTSYIEVAKKYKVSMRQVARHGKEESWKDERERYVTETAKKSIEKTIESESDAVAQRKAEYMDLAKITLAKVLAAIQTCDPEDKDGLRKMVASVKDLQQILMIPTEDDSAIDHEVTVSVIAPGIDTEGWGK